MTNDNILETKRAWQHVNREARIARRLNPSYLTEREIRNLIDALAVIVAIILCAVMLLVAGCNTASAEVVIDMDKIAMIESSGCKHNVGDGGDSNGCHQVSSGTLKEYNQFNGTKHTKQDLLNYAVSLKIATWYMQKRIPAMLKHYGKPDTIENRIVAYNAGINYVVKGKPLPETTKRYIAKYKGSL